MREAWKRAVLACTLVVVAACGGGGGDGGGGGFSLSFDRSSVSMSFDVEDPPAVAVVNVTANGTTNDDIYVGATTPSGQADRNIDYVDVQIGTTSARVVIYPAEDLAPGIYTGTIVLLACRDAGCARHHPGSPHHVSYTITVRDNIRFSARSVHLEGDGGLSVSQVVTVYPPVGVTVESLNVTAADDWLTVTQESPTTFRLTAGPRARGLYSSRITARAGSFTRQLSVDYNALVRSLRLSTDRVDLGVTSGEPAQADVAVTQLAEGATGISTTGGYDAPWLTVAGTSASGFRLQARSMPSGTYRTTLVVTSGVSHVNLPVTYTVAAPPGGDRPMSVTRRNLVFAVGQGAVSTGQRLGLQRPSWDNNVAIAVTPGVNWVRTEMLPDGDVEVRVDAAFMAQGSQHAAEITLTPAYPGLPVHIPVSMTVGAGLAVPATLSHRIGSEPTAANLQGRISVQSASPADAIWTATSTTPWLRITQAQGRIGGEAAYEIDLPALLSLPGYADHVALVNVSAPGFTSVVTRVSARHEIAELRQTGPGIVMSGRATRVMVGGRGLDGLADPLARLGISGGVVPTGVQRLSATTLAVDLPPLAAGRYEFSIGNAVGVTTSRATLRVIDEHVPSPAFLPAQSGTPFSSVYDPVGRTLYEVTASLTSVRRIRQDGAGAWVSDTLDFPTLQDISLTPDGSQLIVVERQNRLHLVDTATFSVTETLAMPLEAAAGTSSATRGLPITHDGKLWLVLKESITQFERVYTFDLRTRAFTQITWQSVGRSFGPTLTASRNGERLVLGAPPTGSSMEPLRFMDISQGVLRPAWRPHGSFQGPGNGMGDTGERFVISGRQVYDADFTLVGWLELPDANWWVSAAVMSPDSRKVYAYAIHQREATNPASPVMPRVYVFDASVAPLGEQGVLPVLGRFDLPAYPTCRTTADGAACGYAAPNMLVAPDARTLYLSGNAGLLVVPLAADRVEPASSGRRTGGLQAPARWSTPSSKR